MTASNVYFVQHGLAVDKAEDPERPLSEAGIQQTRMMAETLYNANVPVSSIYHSGKLRALQTADIFSNTFALPSISIIDGLLPNDDVCVLLQDMNINNALYIGHLPHLEKLVTYLVSGNENNAIIKFQNSATVCLEKVDTRYQIKWMLTPGLTGNT